MAKLSYRKKDKIYHILKRPFEFLSNWRDLPPYELASYFLMFASVPMLAYGIKPYNLNVFLVIILTVITLYSGFFATLIWNDITDSDIDTLAHPDRPIPSGRISKKKFFTIALVFSAMTFIFGLLTSIWGLIIVGIAALFVAFHNKYLKKIIKLPAYSEIFTPIQWVVVAIFGFIVIWTALPQSNEIIFSLPIFGSISTSSSEIQILLLLVAFTYFADNAHDLPEGIHDYEGDLKHGVKTYATSFGPKNASIISFSMFFISGILGILIFIKTVLSPIFMIFFILLWLYIMYYSYKLLRADNKNRKIIAPIVGRKGYDYFLMSYNLIFLSIFVQLIIFHFKFI